MTMTIVIHKFLALKTDLKLTGVSMKLGAIHSFMQNKIAMFFNFPKMYKLTKMYNLKKMYNFPKKYNLPKMYKLTKKYNFPKKYNLLSNINTHK